MEFLKSIKHKLKASCVSKNSRVGKKTQQIKIWSMSFTSYVNNLSESFILTENTENRAVPIKHFHSVYGQTQAALHCCRVASSLLLWFGPAVTQEQTISS